MKIIRPRADFVIVEDFFGRDNVMELLKLILQKGNDPVRGFHHPDLRPNRFHKAPKYPVKKFMCFGFYWNPLDYLYYPLLPDTDAKPHPIPKLIKEISFEILQEFFPYLDYSPESVMVNFYTKDSSMGLHVDKDEEDNCWTAGHFR